MRVTGTTARRAVSTDRNRTPCRPASSIEYSRMFVSRKLPKYGSGSAVPSLVLLMTNGTRATYVMPSANTSGRVPGGYSCATVSGSRPVHESQFAPTLVEGDRSGQGRRGDRVIRESRVPVRIAGRGAWCGRHVELKGHRTLPVTSWRMCRRQSSRNRLGCNRCTPDSAGTADTRYSCCRPHGSGGLTGPEQGRRNGSLHTTGIDRHGNRLQRPVPYLHRVGPARPSATTRRSPPRRPRRKTQRCSTPARTGG